MNLSLDISPQVEARFIALAREKGMEPAKLFEKMLVEFLSSSGREDDRLRGRSVADMIQEIGFIETTGPSDMGRHPEKYLHGFGEADHKRTETP